MTRPFNTALECGLRSLFIANAFNKQGSDLQRVLFLDHILIHSGDVGGPPSLHPAVPDRSGEWLVRRKVMENGLNVMVSRELINKRFSANGIVYSANELTALFLQHLKSPYSNQLRERAIWLFQTFETKSFQDLEAIVAASTRQVK